MKKEAADITFSIRLPKDLKEAFEMTVKARDMTASQEIRAFMRWYVQEHAQPNMFSKKKGK